MKILFVNAPYLPESLGGAEIHTHEMAQRLKARGHEVVVLCSRATSTRTFQGIASEYEGIARIGLEIPEDEQSVWSLREDVTQWTRRWFETWKPDVVHMGIFWKLLGVAEVAHRQGIPVTFICHGYDFFCRQIGLMHPNGEVCDGRAGTLKCMACVSQPWSWIERTRSVASYVKKRMVPSEAEEVRPFEKVLMELREVSERGRWMGEIAAAIVAPSRFMQRALLRNGFSAKKIHWISNGADIERFRAEEKGRDRPATGEPLQFAYMGRLTSSKGVDVMLEAFHGISREMAASLRIYGDLDDPIYRKAAKTWRQQYAGNPRITFEGKAQGQALVRAYHQADVVLMPTRCAENNSLAILEAQAAGKPVIASHVGGIPERVEDGINGRLVPPGNVRALRAALEEVLRNPEQLHRWRKGIAPVPSLETNALALEAVLKNAWEGR